MTWEEFVEAEKEAVEMERLENVLPLPKGEEEEEDFQDQFELPF